jgi:hypothetical protein
MTHLRHALLLSIATTMLSACIGNTKEPPPDPNAPPAYGGPSTPQVLASYIGTPSELTVRGEFLYAVLPGHATGPTYDGRVVKLPRASGSVVELASGLAVPHGVYVDADNLLWVNTSGDAVAPGDLMQLAFAVDATPLSLLRGAGLSAFTVAGPNAYVSGPATITRVSIKSGETSPVAKEGGARHMVTDITNVYFTSGSDVKQVSIAGGPITRLASGGSPKHLAVDGGFVYFSAGSGDNGGIFRVPVDGGEVVPLVQGLNGPTSIAVDKFYVYWTNANLPEFAITGIVMKVPKKGGPALVVVAGTAQTTALTLDDDRVYWAQLDGAAMDSPASLRRALK